MRFQFIDTFSLLFSNRFHVSGPASIFGCSPVPLNRFSAFLAIFGLSPARPVSPLVSLKADFDLRWSPAAALTYATSLDLPDFAFASAPLLPTHSVDWTKLLSLDPRATASLSNQALSILNLSSSWSSSILFSDSSSLRLNFFHPSIRSAVSFRPTCFGEPETPYFLDSIKGAYQFLNTNTGTPRTPNILFAPLFLGPFRHTFTSGSLSFSLKLRLNSAGLDGYFLASGHFGTLPRRSLRDVYTPSSFSTLPSGISLSGVVGQIWFRFFPKPNSALAVSGFPSSLPPPLLGFGSVNGVDSRVRPPCPPLRSATFGFIPLLFPNFDGVPLPSDAPLSESIGFHLSRYLLPQMRCSPLLSFAPPPSGPSHLRRAMFRRFAVLGISPLSSLKAFKEIRFSRGRSRFQRSRYTPYIIIFPEGLREIFDYCFYWVDWVGSILSSLDMELSVLFGLTWGFLYVFLLKRWDRSVSKRIHIRNYFCWLPLLAVILSFVRQALSLGGIPDLELPLTFYLGHLGGFYLALLPSQILKSDLVLRLRNRAKRLIDLFKATVTAYLWKKASPLLRRAAPWLRPLLPVIPYLFFAFLVFRVFIRFYLYVPAVYLRWHADAFHPLDPLLAAAFFALFMVIYPVYIYLQFLLFRRRTGFFRIFLFFLMSIFGWELSLMAHGLGGWPELYEVLEKIASEK